MKNIFFDEDKQKEFNKKGYVIIDLISDSEVAFLLSEIKKLSPDDEFNPSGKDTFGITLHRTIFDKNYEYKKEVDDLIKKVFSQKLGKLIDYKLLIGNLFIKPPDKGDLKVHQNWTLLADEFDTTVSVWCPLVNLNANNGQLRVVEGSHKLVSHTATMLHPEYFHHFIDLIEELATPIFLKTGQAVIFDDSIIHGSKTNTLKIPRYAVQISCIPKDAEPIYYKYSPQAIPDKFERFEIDSEFFYRHSLMDFFEGNIKSKSLGFVDNKNKLISKAEFDELMKNRNVDSNYTSQSNQSNKKTIISKLLEKLGLKSN